MDYIKREVVSSVDIHGRKAMELSQLATSHREEIHLEDNYGRRVSAKSLLGLLSLGINKGDKYQICVSKNTGDTEDTIKHLLSIIGGAE